MTEAVAELTSKSKPQLIAITAPGSFLPLVAYDAIRSKER